jgi:hypothetical protein
MVPVMAAPGKRIRRIVRYVYTVSTVCDLRND